MDNEKPKIKDEKKTMGVSYLYDFYIFVNDLTTLYAQYVNFILQLEKKHGGDNESIDNLEEADRNLLLSLVQQIRYACINSYVKYVPLTKVLKELKEANPLIEKQYLIIEKTLIFKREDIREYVILLNGVIVEDIIKKLLQDNEALINELYKNE